MASACRECAARREEQKWADNLSCSDAYSKAGRRRSQGKLSGKCNDVRGLQGTKYMMVASASATPTNMPNTSAP